MVHPQHLQQTELPESAAQKRRRSGPQQEGATEVPSFQMYAFWHLANTDPDPFFLIILPEYLEITWVSQWMHSWENTQKTLSDTSLVVQGLRLHTPTGGDPSPILHVTWYGQKIFKKAEEEKKTHLENCAYFQSSKC